MLRGGRLLWGAIFLLVLANWLWAFDWNAFRLGLLQSLFEECHERKHGRLGPAYRASKAVDDDGFPNRSSAPV